MIIDLLIWTTLTFTLVLLLVWVAWEFFFRPYRGVFKGNDVRLWIDHTQSLVHIESSNDLESHTLKLGCGQFSYQRETQTETKEKWRPGTSGSVIIYHTGGGVSTGTTTRGSEGYWQTVTKEKPTGFTSVSIDEIDPILYFHQQWATNHSLQQFKTKRSVIRLYLKNRTAKAFKRWVQAHRHQLVPNEKWVRKSWEASCKRLLKECRQDILVKQLKNPLELFDYTPAPNIRYLVIGQNGQGFFKTLASHEMHAITLDQLRGNSNTLTVVFPNGWQEEFSLTSEHITRLHRIRRNGEKHRKSPAHMTTQTR